MNSRILNFSFVFQYASVMNEGCLLGCLLTEKKLESKCSRVMNMSTSSTRPPSCMYCFGELSPMEGTPANMLFPSERDSASSRSRPPPRARFLGEERGRLYLDGACQSCSQSSLLVTLSAYWWQHVRYFTLSTPQLQPLLTTRCISQISPVVDESSHLLLLT